MSIINSIDYTQYPIVNKKPQRGKDRTVHQHEDIPIFFRSVILEVVANQVASDGQ